MNIALMTEYKIEDDEVVFKHRQPDEPKGFIEYILKYTDDNLYIIDGYIPHNNINKVKVLDARNKEEVIIDFNTIDSMLFGFFTHLTDNLKEFLTFIESIQHLDIKFINSIQTIKSNFSKKYLIELANIGLPITPTTIIKSLDQLLSLSTEENFLLKPIISERAKGTVTVNDMTIEEKKKYFETFSYTKGNANQQILCQKFNNDFIQFGEKKICVIKGETSIARLTVPPRYTKKNQIISTSKGSTMIKYIPTPYEKEICRKVYEEFNKIYPAEYIRIDIVGEGDNILISEIEAINPDLITCYSHHSQEDYKELYEKLYKCCLLI